MTYKKLLNGKVVDLTTEEINELQAREVEYNSNIRSNKIKEVKAEAGRRIVEAYPEWKQRNYMAAVIDIQNKELVAIKAGGTYTLSADEVATIQSAQTAKTEVFAIRQKSDELENSLDSMTQVELEAFDPTDDNNWI